MGAMDQACHNITPAKGAGYFKASGYIVQYVVNYSFKNLANLDVFGVLVTATSKTFQCDSAGE